MWIDVGFKRPVCSKFDNLRALIQNLNIFGQPGFANTQNMKRFGQDCIRQFESAFTVTFVERSFLMAFDEVVLKLVVDFVHPNLIRFFTTQCSYWLALIVSHNYVTNFLTWN